MGFSGSAGTVTFPTSQTVTGTLSVGNFPATQTMTGTISTTFPATQTVVMAPAKTFSIAAGAAGPTVVKATAGTYYGMLVSSVGVGIPIVFDNSSAASGTPLDIRIASAPVGPYNAVEGGVAATSGITVSGGATNPAMTIFYQ